MKKRNNLINGSLYFYVHFAFEITTFFILGQFLSFEKVVLLSFVYDFLAFVPQGIFGFILDEKIKFPILFVGIGLTIISLSLLYTTVSPFVIIVIISIASCLIHIAGAERTLREGNGKMTPAAMFVSGGSFGLVIGKILALYSMPIWLVILIASTLLLPAIYFSKHPLDLSKTCEEYHFCNERISPILVVALATLVVAVRSFVSFYIPTSWKKELYQTILLFFIMGLGKCLGGVLIDKIGMKWTSVIATLGALPLLIFGDNYMIVSIFGIMFFSLTMAITLALIVSAMKKRPGVAFGFTTLGLFLGIAPLFFFKIDNKLVNIIIIIVTTIISLVALLICSNGRLFKEEKRNELTI